MLSASENRYKTEIVPTSIEDNCQNISEEVAENVVHLTQIGKDHLSEEKQVCEGARIIQILQFLNQLKNLSKYVPQLVAISVI